MEAPHPNIVVVSLLFLIVTFVECRVRCSGARIIPILPLRSSRGTILLVAAIPYTSVDALSTSSSVAITTGILRVLILSSINRPSSVAICPRRPIASLIVLLLVVSTTVA